MSDNFLTYVDVTDATKGAYCPRQVYYMSPEFKETSFFTQYCANVPCRGDICKNRSACWEMLASKGPYVQDDYIKISQTPKCPADFFGQLAEYAHDCGCSAEKIFNQFRVDFGTTEFCAHTCPMGKVKCFVQRFKGELAFDSVCWPRLLKELQTRKK